MHLSLDEWVAGAVTSPARPEAMGEVQVPAAVSGSTRSQHAPGMMNGLEKRYAQHLALRRTVGEIMGFKFEPLKLRLAPKTYYSPDFSVMMPDGRVELHEVKGGHWEDDARVKIKCAAAMFPEFRIVAAQEKGKGNWVFEEFGA